MTDQSALSLHEPTEHWGGPWTEKKLDAFSRYVEAYLTILQAHPYWKTIYFDGFAGNGSRKDLKTELYNQLKITLEEEEGYRGAAERVVSLDNCFDYYYFIDNQESLDKLKEKLTSLPVAKNRELVFRTGDCNEWLKKLAASMRSHEKVDVVGIKSHGEGAHAFDGETNGLELTAFPGTHIQLEISPMAVRQYHFTASNIGGCNLSNSSAEHQRMS